MCSRGCRRCCMSKLCWGSILVIGVVSIVLGLTIFTVIIDKQVEKNLDLWNLDSEGRKNFETPPVPVRMRFFIFEVTNPVEVRAGGKASFIERGPYSYTETREKINISSESEGRNHIRYGQYKSYIFDPADSCDGCTAFDEVFVLNAPLVGVVALLETLPFSSVLLSLFNDVVEGNIDIEWPPFLGEPPIDLSTYEDDLFMKVPVEDLIFRGVRPGSIEFVFLINDLLNGTIELPSVIGEDGFAVFAGKNGTANHEWYEANTGDSDLSLYTNLEKWGVTEGNLHDDLTPEGWWEENGGYMGSNDCNALLGTDGQQFHPSVQEDDRLWIFQTDLCRTIYLTFEEESSLMDIPSYRFVLPYRALQANTTFNLGFCMEVERDEADWNQCAVPDPSDPEVLNLTACNLGSRSCPDGLLDITRCMERAPVALSSPYFYQGAEFLRDDFKDFPAPNRTQHETSIHVEPNSGVAMEIARRIQVNVPVERVRQMDSLSLFPRDRIYFPFVWLEEWATLDEENADLLRKMVVKPLKAAEVLKWLMVALGGVAVIVSTLVLMKLFCTSQEFV